MSSESKQHAGQSWGRDQAVDTAPRSPGHPSYHFKAHEKIPDGVKRIILEQIDWASYCLTTGTEIDAAIHDSRVCFKKIRAVLRLVREEIGDRDFRAENARYRDAGRRLSAVRDSAVAIDTFDRLTDNTGILVEP